MPGVFGGGRVAEIAPMLLIYATLGGGEGGGVAGGLGGSVGDCGVCLNFEG